jgi:2'-5' RNA ligase
MRLFIASAVKLEDYGKIIEDFSDVIKGKWVKEENLHLTWVFLGEQKEAAPFGELLQNIPPLSRKVPVRGMGYFGRPPKIFYANTKGKVLFDTASAFERAGFQIGRFRPHITLCRIKKILDYSVYKERVKSYRNKVLGTVLPEIILYESRLTQEGANYIEIMKSGKR